MNYEINPVSAAKRLIRFILARTSLLGRDSVEPSNPEANQGSTESRPTKTEDIADESAASTATAAQEEQMDAAADSAPMVVSQGLQETMPPADAAGPSPRQTEPPAALEASREMSQVRSLMAEAPGRPTAPQDQADLHDFLLDVISHLQSHAQELKEQRAALSDLRHELSRLDQVNNNNRLSP